MVDQVDAIELARRLESPPASALRCFVADWAYCFVEWYKSLIDLIPYLAFREARRGLFFLFHADIPKRGLLALAAPSRRLREAFIVGFNNIINLFSSFSLKDTPTDMIRKLREV